MSVLMFIQGSSASTKAEAALRPGGAMGSLMEDVVTCKKTLEEAASSEEQARFLHVNESLIPWFGLN